MSHPSKAHEAAYRSARASIRPLECALRSPCWVEDARSGVRMIHGLPHCIGCGVLVPPPHTSHQNEWIEAIKTAARRTGRERYDEDTD